MALFNYASREITLKIVYYGPGLSGKTTNLQHLHSTIEPDKRGKLLSLATETDRTLFFDLMPVAHGKIKEFSVRFQVYTVPGQVRYNSTRKLLLKGADAIVFVADSQKDMREDNMESFKNMKENLSANNINPDDIPIVLQYNKRDLSGGLSEEELDLDLNQSNHQTVCAEAINGKGVMETFQTITGLLIKDLSKKHGIAIETIKTMEEVKKPPKPEPLKMPEPLRMPEPEPEPEMEEIVKMEEPPVEFDFKKPEPQVSEVEEAVSKIPPPAAGAVPAELEPLLRDTSEAVSGLAKDIRELNDNIKKVLNLLQALGKAVKEDK